SHLGRDPLRVLDLLSIHVDNVEGSIGPMGLAHGPKPAVRRGQELNPVSRRAAMKSSPILAQDLLVDEVSGRLASEDGAAVRCGEEASAVDEDAASGREGPGAVSG